MKYTFRQSALSHMKKIIFLTALVALAACQKENVVPEIEPVPEPELETPAETTATPIVFDLSADYADGGPATKAVKTGWEAGDVIYVFFEGVPSPRHLQMRYDGSAWTNVEMNAANVEVGALGLQEGDTGTMRAVHLPFATSSTRIWETTSTHYAFYCTGEEDESYYLTATLTFVVKKGKVSGAFNMTIPEGYVQFWIEDASAGTSSSRLVLSTGAICSAWFWGVTEHLDINQDKSPYGYAMAGNPYKGGWLFSGFLDPNYLDEYGNNYYFVLRELNHRGFTLSRKNLFVSGKTISNHNAIVLPAKSSTRWLEVGPDKTVELVKDGVSYGEWHTCNYDASAPEDSGTKHDYSTATSLGYIVPSVHQWQNLIKDPVTNEPTLNYASIRFKESLWGLVIWGDSGFIFLPEGAYWTSLPGTSIRVGHSGFGQELYGLSDILMVRALKSPTTPTFNPFHDEISF